MAFNLKQLIDGIEGEILTVDIDPQTVEIEDGYVSDLLSDVMGNASQNQVWVTIMRHLNSIAVASLAGIPCIVYARGIKPEKEVIAKAEEEKVLLISTKLPSFVICGKLYALLHNLK